MSSRSTWARVGARGRGRGRVKARVRVRVRGRGRARARGRARGRVHEQQVDLRHREHLRVGAALLEVAAHGRLELEPHLARRVRLDVHRLRRELLAQLLRRRRLRRLREPLEGNPVGAHHLLGASEVVVAVDGGEGVVRQPVTERLDVAQRERDVLRDGPAHTRRVEERAKADGGLLLLVWHAQVDLTLGLRGFDVILLHLLELRALLRRVAVRRLALCVPGGSRAAILLELVLVGLVELGAFGLLHALALERLAPLRLGHLAPHLLHGGLHSAAWVSLALPRRGATCRAPPRRACRASSGVEVA